MAPRVILGGHQVVRTGTRSLQVELALLGLTSVRETRPCHWWNHFLEQSLSGGTLTRALLPNALPNVYPFVIGVLVVNPVPAHTFLLPLLVYNLPMKSQLAPCVLVMVSWADWRGRNLFQLVWICVFWPSDEPKLQPASDTIRYVLLRVGAVHRDDFGAVGAYWKAFLLRGGWQPCGSSTDSAVGCGDDSPHYLPKESQKT